MNSRRDHLFEAALRRARQIVGRHFPYLGGFRSSQDYWIRRYRSGGTSGAGSILRQAEFKADFLNRFVRERGISTVIEFGSGDGTQLRLAEYPRYLGFDISPEALELCRRLFAADETKSFRLAGDYRDERAELALSLDVIYHLVEDDTFEVYMARLFDSATRFVVIYSTNSDRRPWMQLPHVRHRRFSTWVESNRPQWQLLARHQHAHADGLMAKQFSLPDFFVYGVRSETCPSDACR